MFHLFPSQHVGFKGTCEQEGPEEAEVERLLDVFGMACLFTHC